ncbi:hypothetical protein SAMN05661096_02022 [Marivirga sericea]|uniref:Uncharacterized protein n=1 Tax=Marivirga sericea TaxID=1028 RepID=A0A1X7JV91_9BACT|nr:hypothetical protein [Marivirga sericea]SMG32326.1 hypothetical protein SAMN05661096_02022 [Marivirga sericea]
MKVYAIGLLFCLQIFLINYSIAQGLVECNDQLSYEIIEVNEDIFDIEVRLNSESSIDFVLKLYTASAGGEFVSQLDITKSKGTATFAGLSKNKVYLIQAINNECTVTLGGMEGIKVEKE